MCWLAERALIASGPDAASLTESIVACAVRRAGICRGDLDAGGSDAGDAGDAANANWTKVLFDCAEELGL
jgi:hypothetical protein